MNETGRLNEKAHKLKVSKAKFRAKSPINFSENQTIDDLKTGEIHPKTATNTGRWSPIKVNAHKSHKLIDVRFFKFQNFIHNQNKHSKKK